MAKGAIVTTSRSPGWKSSAMGYRPIFPQARFVSSLKVPRDREGGTVQKPWIGLGPRQGVIHTICPWQKRCRSFGCPLPAMMEPLAKRFSTVTRDQGQKS